MPPIVKEMTTENATGKRQKWLCGTIEQRESLLENGAAEWTERLSRRMATRRFHAIHFAAPF